MARQARKLILLDLDGTLVGSGHRVPMEAELAVQTARSNGHLVMICTGRANPEIEKHILNAGFDGMIAASGAYVEAGGRLLSERYAEPSAVTHATAVFDDLGVDYLWQSSKGMWGTHRYLATLRMIVRATRSITATEHWYDIAESRDIARERGCGIGDVVPASKGTFLVPDGSDVTIDDVRKALGDEWSTINGSMGAFAKVNGEVMIPDVTKGSALRDVAAHTGIPMKDVVAVGDSDNDLPMLETAGTAVAMGNGTESVKRIADIVTDDVDEGGLFNAFDTLGLL